MSAAERDQVLAAFRELVARARALEDSSLIAEMSAQLRAQEASPPAESGAEDTWHGILGRSPAVLALRESLPRLAAVAAPVLIQGPSGTGKDLVAEVIHQLSPRASAPLVKENCAAVPETLIESVLFGHVRGAFTGAHRDHPGHFVAADGGTLFLDEVGEMPASMQAKLLRTLQEGEVRPVGAERTRKVDVRVVAATNRDLEQMVAAGSFRQDLFYRLNVLTVDLPALRERPGDALLLARHFLQGAAAKAGRELRFSPAAEAAIDAFAWPGNVRQVINEVHRLAALCDGPEIGAEELSPQLRGL